MLYSFSSLRIIFITFFTFIAYNSVGQFLEVTNHPFTDSLWYVDMHGGHVIIAGKEGLLVSTDNGVSFSEVNQFNNQNSQQRYENSIFFSVHVHDNHFWACGSDTSTNEAVVFYRNSLSSSNWSNVYSTSETSKFVHCGRGSNHRIYFIGENYCAKFYMSTPNQMPYQGSIHSSSSSPYTQIWECGTNCMVARSEDYISRFNTSTNEWTHQPNNLNFIKMNKPTGSSNPNIFINTADKYISQQPFTNFSNFEAYNANSDLTCIANYGSGFFMGKKEGILHRDDSDDFYELIVGTEQYDIVDMGSSPYFNNNCAYAVTADGKILRSSSFNYDTYPLAEYKNDVNYCAGDTVIIENLGDNSNDYFWYLDNDLISTDFNLEYEFTQPGIQQLKLRVEKGSYEDSITKIINITTPPDTSINYSVNTNIICHQGEVTFNIETEANRSYALIREGLTQPDTVFTGTGNDDITTQLITDTTSFSLIANYPSTICYEQYFLDTIIVQKPKADFHSTHLNQDPGDSIFLYDLSIRSDTSEWLLNSHIQPIVDNEYVTNYSQKGYHDLGLVAITDFGCRDTIIKEDVLYIIDTSIYHDGCFDLFFAQQNHYHSMNSLPIIISDMIMDDEENVYMGGMSEYLILPTTQGKIPDTLDNFGFFIAKYNKYGVLKWFTTFGLNIDEVYSNVFRSRITKMKINKNGDITVTFRQTIDLETKYISNDGEVFKSNVGSVTSGSSLAILNIDNLGKYYNLTRGSTWYSSVQPTGGIDDNGNIYFFSDTEINGTHTFFSRDSSTNISSPSNHRLVKIKPDGNAVWSVETEFDPHFAEHYFDVVDDQFYLIGKDFDENLYSSDGNVVQALGNTTTNSKSVLACYDTSGVYKWHYQIPQVTNGRFLMNADDEGNVYLSFHGWYTDSIILVDWNGTQINIPNRLIKFDRDGNIDFNYSGILSNANNNSTNRTHDLEVWGNEVKYLANSNATQAQQQFPINQSSTTNLSFPHNLNGLYYGARYDEDGVLLDSFFVASDINPDTINDVFLATQTIFDHSSSYYSKNITSFGLTWRNTNYFNNSPVNGSYRWLVTNNIEHDCHVNQFIAEIQDTFVCHVDTSVINLNIQVPGLQQFASENVFSLESSSNPTFDFVQSTLIDTLALGNQTSGIPWNFNFSQIQHDTLWFRVASSHPSLKSDPFYIVFQPEQNDSVIIINSCIDDTNQLVSMSGNNYTWFDHLNNQMVNTLNEMSVVMPDSAVFYYVDVINSCNISWRDTFKLEPFIIHHNHPDTIFKCVDDTLLFSFDSLYSYTFVSPHLNQINSNEFLFNFSQPMLVNYEMLDTNSCTLQDSIFFDLHPIEVVNFETIGPPWEIIVSNIQDFHGINWDSSHDFTHNFANNSIYPLETGNFYFTGENSFGCVSKDSIYFSNLSLSNNDFENLIYYPNPTSDIVYFNLNRIENIDLQVLDKKGRVVLNKEINGEKSFSIDFSSFAEGVYTVRIENKDNSATLKVVKQ